VLPATPIAPRIASNIALSAGRIGFSISRECLRHADVKTGAKPGCGGFVLAVTVSAHAALTIAIGFGARTRTSAFAASAVARQAFCRLHIDLTRPADFIGVKKLRFFILILTMRRGVAPFDIRIWPHPYVF
jgi:hypothetical protein